MSTPFTQLVHKFAPQSTLRRAWTLTGGVSAQITALEIEQPDGTLIKWVVRQHGEGDRAENPNIAADEFKLLQTLRSTRVAAPVPYYVDTSNDIFPTPYLVVEFIDGQPDFSPADLPAYLRQFADHLARIHRVDPSGLSFLPDVNTLAAHKPKNRPAVLDDSLYERRIRDTLDAAFPPAQVSPSSLLHGDYWHGNVLWKNGTLVAVIDWEDAKLGDPLYDLANARMETLWAFGLDAMHTFTYHYQALVPQIDYTFLPHWDLYLALHKGFKFPTWGLDDAAMQKMHGGLQAFITHAFEKLTM